MNVYLALIWVFTKIGLFAFGGGTAMLPLIYQSIQPFGVMDGSDFSDMVAISQVTPGPVAINAATYVGLKFAGITGAVVATIAVCIPCFVVMLTVIKLLEKFKGNPYVEGAFMGIRPVTIGLILVAAVFIAEGVLVKGSVFSADMAEFDYYNLIPLGICGLSVVLLGLFKVKPIYVMLVMAAAGAVIYG
ncbi:MAG: chromate transporter, partial [Firmicutes bacterium]|nr:chromate transporter [Bacillota bacterium]MDY6174698.1 chromate transporter [Lentihominibacter sp.]